MGLFLTVIAIIGGGIFFIYFNKREEPNIESSFETINLNNCDKEYLVGWFKNRETLAQLKEKEEYIAIVIKETHPLAKIVKIETSNAKKIVLIQCIFDENKNEIIMAQILKCSTVSQEINEMFGKSDMIVLS